MNFSPTAVLRHLAGISPAFLLPTLAGMFLRLYGLAGQFPLDDEWHSLNFVLDKSLWATLTTQGFGANCIPQNVLNWILLHTTGWSETVLVLPSILCGFLGLLIFPGLVRRLAGRTAAVFFSWLLAISPCLVFYARIARPYAMVLFFGFLALLNLMLWSREGGARRLVAYALCAFAAIYFHLYAALPLLAPLGALWLWILMHPHTRAAAPWLSGKSLGGAGALMLVLGLVFLLPAHWQNPWWRHALGASRVTGAGLWEFLSLLAGTGMAALKLAYAALVAGGFLRWLHREPREGWVLAAIWGAFFLLLAVATQDGMHAAIQIARYNILLFPLSMLLASVALEGLLSRLPAAVPPRARIPLGLLPVAALLIGSPLWRTFALPNNFMHHSAFQDSYAPFDWTQSRVRQLTPVPPMPAARIAPFYARVAADPSVPGLIEYPMYLGDSLNLHYYTQHFHRKPVVAGYLPDLPFPPLPAGNELVFQITPLDYVLSRAHAAGKGRRMKFRNLVPLTDAAHLRRDHSGWLLVIHRDILRETIGPRVQGASFIPPDWLHGFLDGEFGAPVHSDRQITAWRMP